MTDAEPCTNEEWVADNPGTTIEWARTMWWCECPLCAIPEAWSDGEPA